jgi:LEA14-like dessication related protein
LEYSQFEAVNASELDVALTLNYQKEFPWLYTLLLRKDQVKIEVFLELQIESKGCLPYNLVLFKLNQDKSV